MPRRSRDEKRLRRNRIMIGLFIILLMVMSGFAIMLDGLSGSSLTDWGIQLQVKDEQPYYRAKIGGQHFEFYYTPSDANLIPMDESVPSLLSGAGYIVFSFHPDTIIDVYYVVDLLRFQFDEFYPQPVFLAIQSENQTFSLPVITCMNATTQTPVVEFIVDDRVNEIIREGDCVTIKGSTNDFLRARDKLMYSTLGVYSER
jgi:hypothetical protein